MEHRFNSLRERTDTFIFHAGTTLENGKIKTSGGRVLGVTAKEKSLKVGVHTPAFFLCSILQ